MTRLKWILQTSAAAFSLYWLSNLILWIPWIINPVLGMVLMLTVGTAIWSLGIYISLKHNPGFKPATAALLTAAVMLFFSVLSDYIFFGIIRGAMEELYHPTTLYGYGFVAALPFIEILILKKALSNAKESTWKKTLLTFVPGITALAGLILLIRFPLPF